MQTVTTPLTDDQRAAFARVAAVMCDEAKNGSITEIGLARIAAACAYDFEAHELVLNCALPVETIASVLVAAFRVLEIPAFCRPTVLPLLAIAEHLAANKIGDGDEDVFAETIEAICNAAAESADVADAALTLAASLVGFASWPGERWRTHAALARDALYVTRALVADDGPGLAPLYVAEMRRLLEESRRAKRRAA